ncbi:MAG: heme o synthase [Gammaproteobacteria bacterium]|nr:heme o synthase [Gammaproteobacteria bacterium]
MQQTRIVLDLLDMTKPRVVLLMLACALVGMLLASQNSVSLPLIVAGLLGIALVAGSAAVMNHVIDAEWDRRMARTQNRPVATGRIRPREGILFSLVLGIAGATVLFVFVNPLAAWLNLASWLGYGIFYSIFLKHNTSQNIVVGGLFGAAPPLLGWVSITNTIEPGALVLVLIIFLWTPPHFWALAIDRIKDYKSAGIPMLPLTHGDRYTRWWILAYTVLLFVSTLLPFFIGMSGWLYLSVAVLLGVVYLGYSVAMLVVEDPKLPLKSFRYSITYLTVLFAGLLLDHYLPEIATALSA